MGLLNGEVGLTLNELASLQSHGEPLHVHDEEGLNMLRGLEKRRVGRVEEREVDVVGVKRIDRRMVKMVRKVGVIRTGIIL